ncbi:hypothetical membrane associated protein [Picrophilus oshimae DSM 9789]|uniref:Hypothetical membrane associated protein n=2 Tax=Picrophilus oshimae TaxID=46632 RepID=Q6KYW4_PICTO|nr:hypothetical membrane associated protein [Picrophilus oshimae DSM 9789]
MIFMIYIGCSGWFYLHWYKKFYPGDLKKSQWFKYYTSKFNTVEINSTFYRMPDERTFKNYYRNSPENFVYSVKMNKLVTHINKLNDPAELINSFIKNVSILKEKLKCVLYQMPPSFKRSDENIKNIIENIPGGSFIEFRSRSWDPKSINDIINSGIHVVSVSSKKMPFNLYDDKILYLRFHGDENGYMTDYSDRLDYFAELILENNFDESYIYFNNDYNGLAPKNALRLIEILNSK